MRYVRGALSWARHPILRNPVRWFMIQTARRRLLETGYDRKEEGLIIILTPGYDIITGGILSIASICNETLKLKSVHESEAVLCTLPGDPPLLRYTRFENDNRLFGFSMVLNYFTNIRRLIIHVPEYGIRSLVENLSAEDYRILRNIDSVQINVMMQNIRLLSDFRLFDILRDIGKVTCTTAHQKYSTAEIRKSINCPLHKLSTYVSPEQYDRRAYQQKCNLMIVSHDLNPRKDEILGIISRTLPSLDVRVVRNMSYEEFKAMAATAKWALTFGEGLDNYFIETVFSGGISFAVYNQEFFTSDFASLETVYQDIDTLSKMICSDIKRLDNEREFRRYGEEEYRLCSRHYNHQEYLENLKRFYDEDYTLP